MGNLPLEIWHNFDKQREFSWKLQGAALASLKTIIPRPEDLHAIDCENLSEANRRLRSLVSPILKGGDPHQAKALARWIVSEWGGIRRNAEAIPAWVDHMIPFTSSSVHDFVNKQGFNRISSWSKILAFANPDQDAIYDARTAVALNCGLWKLGDNRRFHMPKSRNTSVKLAQEKLANKQSKECLGYFEYIEFLKESVNAGIFPDILSAEMCLFSNAPQISDIFMDKIKKKSGCKS